METAIQVVTMMGDRADAEKIARLLIDAGLAACVQISGPVHSIYRWKDNVESAQEWQCLIKTRKDLYDDVVKVIKTHHPYEVPEIIATSVLQGSHEYLTWLHGVLRP